MATTEKAFPYKEKEQSKKWIIDYLTKVTNHPIIKQELEYEKYQLVLNFKEPNFTITIDLPTADVNCEKKGPNATVTMSCKKFQNFLDNVSSAGKICLLLEVEGEKADDIRKFIGKNIKELINEYTAFQIEKRWI